MSIPKKVPITQYQQQSDTFCAPTCAEMVLSSLGVTPRDMPSQSALNLLVEVSSGPLNGGNPDGLVNALRSCAPATFTGTFDVTPARRPHRASDHVVQALYALDVPVPVMVEDCSHWVAVHGVDTDVVPTAEACYQIEAFWFHDPADEPLIPPTGPEHHVPYAEWLNTWLTGCTKFPKPFIIVAGPVFAPTGTLCAEPPEQSPPNDELIDPSAATGCALDGLTSYGLARYGLANEDDAYTAEPPQLVERIDRNDDFSYLVPLRRHDGTYTVVRVDAHDGAYLGAQFGRADFPYTEPQQFTVRLEGLAVTTDEFAVRLSQGTFEVHPRLVWRPSLESSPYHPVYQVAAGDATVWADAHARLYSRFTMM
jgi:hypothetical protein